MCLVVWSDVVGVFGPLCVFEISISTLGFS